MTEILVHVAGYPDSSEEERAELAIDLREELLSTPVDDVRHGEREEEGPEGEKGTVLEWAELIVEVSGTLPTLLGALRGWVKQNRGATVTVSIGGDTITLEDASIEERRDLLEAFERRHADTS